MTYDEAYSFRRYGAASLDTIVAFCGDADANNHTLNTLLMRLAAATAGNSELALRLPNVLAFAGYVAAVLLLTRRLRHGLARALTVVLFVLNPFILELFSLARGYGLSVCFAMASLAAMAAAADSGRRGQPRWGALSLGTAFAGLAVLANLTLLNYFGPYLLIVAMMYSQLWHTGGPRGASAWPRASGALRSAGATIIAASLVGLYAAVAIYRLRARGGFYYGGTTGFWSDTVDSLLRCWLYIEPYSAAVKPVLWALVILVAVAAVVMAFRRGETESGPARDLLRMVGFILAAGAAASVVAHVLLGTPYLINRTAAWMLPCFLLVLVCELEMLLSAGSRAGRRAAKVFGWCLMVATIAHAAMSATVRYAILQYHDSDTKEMLQDLGRLQAAGLGGGRPIVLAASWELAPAIEYYRENRPIPWLAEVAASLGPADAMFQSPKDLQPRNDMSVVKRYPRTGNVLAVRTDAR